MTACLQRGLDLRRSLPGRGKSIPVASEKLKMDPFSRRSLNTPSRIRTGDLLRERQAS